MCSSILCSPVLALSPIGVQIMAPEHHEDLMPKLLSLEPDTKQMVTRGIDSRDGKDPSLCVFLPSRESLYLGWEQKQEK